MKERERERERALLPQGIGDELGPPATRAPQFSEALGGCESESSLDITLRFGWSGCTAGEFHKKFRVFNSRLVFRERPRQTKIVSSRGPKGTGTPMTLVLSREAAQALSENPPLQLSHGGTAASARNAESTYGVR